MTTPTRTQQPGLSAFQRELVKTGLRHGAYEIPAPGLDSAAGLALNAALIRYAVDPFGRLRVGCPHAEPGVATMLLLDEAVPKVRCVRCTEANRPVVTVDADVCRLCGTGSRRFFDLTWMTYENLTISVNVCPLCTRDLS